MMNSPKIKSIKEKMSNLSTKIQTLQEELGTLSLELKKEVTAQLENFTPTVDFILSSNGWELDGLGQKFYNATNAELKRECPDIRYSGIYTTEPFQRALEIMLRKQGDTTDYVRQINRVLPLLCKWDKKSKRISLFEHTLSEWGSYDIRTKDDVKWDLTVTTYGHTKVLKSFDTLTDCITYCQEYHYYEE